MGTQSIVRGLVEAAITVGLVTELMQSLAMLATTSEDFAQLTKYDTAQVQALSSTLILILLMPMAQALKPFSRAFALVAVLALGQAYYWYQVADILTASPGAIGDFGKMSQQVDKYRMVVWAAAAVYFAIA